MPPSQVWLWHVKKGRTQYRRLPHCAGSGGGYYREVFSTHRATLEATARTYDLSVHRRQALPLVPGRPFWLWHVNESFMIAHDKACLKNPKLKKWCHGLMVKPTMIFRPAHDMPMWGTLQLNPINRIIFHWSTRLKGLNPGHPWDVSWNMPRMTHLTSTTYTSSSPMCSISYIKFTNT